MVEASKILPKSPIDEKLLFLLKNSTHNLNYNADLFFIKKIKVSPSTYDLTLTEESSSILIEAEKEGEYEIEIQFENK